MPAMTRNTMMNQTCMRAAIGISTVLQHTLYHILAHTHGKATKCTIINSLGVQQKRLMIAAHELKILNQYLSDITKRKHPITLAPPTRPASQPQGICDTM